VKTTEPISADALYPTLKSLLHAAEKAGAESADVIATHSRSLGISVRENALEDIESMAGRDIGLRVMIGQRQACVSSSDLSSESLTALAERAVAMAKLAPEDPWCGLADQDRLADIENIPDLDVYDDTEMNPETLKSRAHVLEAATLSVKGVGQAEGANASWSTSAMAYATSHGFLHGWRASRHGLSVSAIAERDGAMERDYDYETTRYFSQLPDPVTIGHSAGQRAVARLGSRQIESAAMPVIFDERVAGAIISSLLGAITGPAITRGVSFLKDKLNTPLFSSNIQIIDDPHLRSGDGSRPWDGEGLAVRKQNIVENGVLKTWLLNCATARQLGLESTGHATRGLGGPPGVNSTNTWLEPGQITPEALAAEMGEGFLISEMFGPSLNSNTGDYSVGVSGFKIENGQRAFPVSEITIAGNLLDVYRTLIPANDLKMDSSTCSPSFRVEGLTIAGA